MDIMEKFWSNVEVTDGGCWEWTGTKFNTGYGFFSIDGRGFMAHRFICLIYNETIADMNTNLVTDHLCRNKPCVNPEHLEMVTIAENTFRGNSPVAQYKKRDCCGAGHKYVDGSFRLVKSQNNTMVRRCIECSRKLRRKRYLTLGV